MADKSHFCPLRWFHFIVLAYLMMVLFTNRGHLLNGRVFRVIAEMGRQSLPIFTLGLALSYIGGMVFDQAGHGAMIILLINLGGCTLLLFAARLITWIESSPWKFQGGHHPSPDHENGRGGLLPFQVRSRLQWLSRASAMALLAPMAMISLTFSQRKAEATNPKLALTENNWTTSESAAATQPDPQLP